MVLLIHGEELKSPSKTLLSLSSFLQVYKGFFEAGADLLKNLQKKKVTAETLTVYISQREYGVIGNNVDEVSGIGTDMATTCHIVVLQYGKEITALGHFDGACTGQGVKGMIDALISEAGFSSDEVNTIELDLHIIGGYEDDRKLSEKLSIELLNEFHNYRLPNGLSDVEVHLKTFCASTLNMTAVSNVDRSRGDDSYLDGTKSPVVLGVLVECPSGTISPAVFDDNAKGPLLALRSSRSLNGVKKMEYVFRPKEACFVIEPFTYEPIARIDEWLSQPDYVLRQYLSTSPDVEPENFEQHIRETLKFISDNPNPLKTIFDKQEPLRFKPVWDSSRFSWTKSMPR